MDQRAIMLFVMVMVVLGMGAFVAYDMTTNDRLEKITGKESSNWNWNDNWDNTDGPSVNPVKPNEVTPEVPQNRSQIVASSYQEAIRKSGELGMPVLVYFEADWCSWCQKMKREVLTDAKVKQMMKNYVLVHVNTDKERSVARKFGVSGLPAFVITNSAERKLKMDQGYMNADKFTQWLNNPNLFKQPKQENRRITPPRTQPDDDDRRWPRFPRDRDDQQRRSPG